MYNKIFLFDKKIRKNFKAELLAGVDEVGRGSIFGPIVAVSVVFDSNVYIPHLKESKSLSCRQRNFIFKEILNKAKSVSCDIISTCIINKIGIQQANLLAIKNAIEKLSIKPDFIIIDGYLNPYIKTNSISIINADKKSAVVAAASVVAKVIRDYIIDLYYKIFKYYDLNNNKGYATLKHTKLIKNIGLCELHRYYAYKFI